MIQNRACRIIYGLRKRDSVTSYMKEIHWLKIKELIEFKVILLVYKSQNDQAPTYLSELIQYNSHSGSRTHNLESGSFNTRYGYRAFQVCGPKLWNALPLYIKTSQSTEILKKRLKEFLFHKSYP